MASVFCFRLFSCLVLVGCLPAQKGAERPQTSSPDANDNYAPARSQPASGSGDAAAVADSPAPLPSQVFTPPSLLPNPTSPMPSGPILSPTAALIPPGEVTVSPTPAETPTGQVPIATPPPVAVSHYYVFGMDSSSRLYNVFLGCLTCNEFDTASVFNSYGSYGSAYSQTSINNQFSTWGSDFSDFSACNRFAMNPPAVVSQDGKIAWYWTLNSLKPGRVLVSSLVDGLKRICEN